MTFLTKLAQWHLRRVIKKEQEKKLTEMDKKRMEVYKQLKALYEFVKWLNTKGLPQRQQRKQFWDDVKRGHSVMESVINQVAERYAPKSSVKVIEYCKCKFEKEKHPIKDGKCQICNKPIKKKK
jgi:hypothetical protein